MSKAIECPTCGALSRPPQWKGVGETPWSDACACSDRVTCAVHQVSRETVTRPSNEVLWTRTESRYQRQLAEWETKQAYFATARRKAEQAIDNPELDATDGAHPAWWRGHDYVSSQFRDALLKERARVAELEASIRTMMLLDHENRARWRDAGLSLHSVRELVARYELDEISVGKLVEELRGLAESAIQARGKSCICGCG